MYGKLFLGPTKVATLMLQMSYFVSFIIKRLEE